MLLLFYFVRVVPKVTKYLIEQNYPAFYMHHSIVLTVSVNHMFKRRICEEDVVKGVFGEEEVWTDMVE